MKRQKSTEGFTLLELLMVVIIIGILATLALPQYIRTTERARAAEGIQMLATLRGSEWRYQAGHPAGNFTNNFLELDVQVNNTDFWNFSPTIANNTGDLFATRFNGGVFSGANLQLDLVSGNLCSNNTVYGLPSTGC